ncbi:beta-ketoacyl-ACP reductase [Gemmatimonas phototrophica]|uniref:3-oxoacyl-[acyl-carrier-protein] reductase FabG n=1 Tax=Gemmatimonas phototrophica TaxID=1379270 RepID=A0A143BL64_9BACT|nr:beta-ketoacyl-ACP reductase [Gemmatimonas phototrophica]AMW05184.1 3-oxoacyl-ACP synthase [Gemmatimonas phototrophica]
MHIELTSRVAIVTGGANGIGVATARRLAASGAHVVIWDRVPDAGARVVAELTDAGHRALFIATDVTNRASVEAAVAQTVAACGGIDVLINNAGITRDAQLVKVKDGAASGGMSEADFDAVIDVNLKGVFNCTQAVVPYLVQRGGGRIVNASSVVALNGNFGQTNYVATKAGVIGMTKVWARELGKRGITVNAVAPGFIATEMTAKMPAAALEGMQAHTPVGRLGSPEDVANAYCFLVSDQAAFINGAVLTVDGGLVIGT